MSQTAHAHTPQLWHEAGAGLEFAALMWDPVFRGSGVLDGAGHPVMLLPGWLVGDGSLRTMAGWLARVGYRPRPARLGWNIDCASAAIERLGALVKEYAEDAGQPVALVGQSRGGLLARALAVRDPASVAGVVTLGSPLSDMLASHPLIRGAFRTVARLGDGGKPGRMTSACLDGECCARFRADLTEPFPASVSLVSVYSRYDGIIDWRACHDPAARLVEVRSSHTGMVANPGVYRAIADALESFWRQRRSRWPDFSRDHYDSSPALSTRNRRRA
jgi:pimeloyl-ACP methyl ester carboxylesterase